MADPKSENKPENVKPGNQQGKKFSRAIFPLLDAQFQFKVTLCCVVFILVSHFFLYYIHFLHISSTTAIAMEKSGQELEDYLQRQNVVLMRNLVLSVFVISAIVGLIVFALTKKVSGPLFNFSRVFDEITKGNMGKRVNIRDSDEFHWLAEKFNSMLDVLEQRFNKKG